MPEAYDLHDARFLMEAVANSAANAVYLAMPVVPEGKIWTVLSASYNPDVAETKICWFVIVSRGGNNHPVTQPVSILLNPATLPALTMGMELRLYPGERIQIFRDSATAGSAMYLRLRYIETDLPYYSYEEPLKKVVRVSQRHGAVYRSTGGISPGGGGGGGGGVPPEGGGGGEPQPI
jgi:hypothetical protein